MAKIERSINEDFDQLLKYQNGILNSSISATLEDASDFQSGTARCSVRIFERYRLCWRKQSESQYYTFSKR